MSKGKITEEQRLKQANSRLKNENAFLRSELKKRDEQITVLEQKLEKALLYIEELQRYVFRKKKKMDGSADDDTNSGGGASGAGNGKQRDASSYRRSIPAASEVTDEKIHSIENCPHCQTKLTKLKLSLFYEEDILPLMEWRKVLKKVKRIKITAGYCPACKKRVSAAPIPKQKVVLGRNVRQLIVFLNTIEQLSHSQIIEYAENCLHIKLSGGEITNILAKEANKLKPAYEDLLQHIRGKPAVHLDETGWKTANNSVFGGDFVWAMAGAFSEDVVYAFGKNRGGGTARELVGEGFAGVGITDDYNAYKNLFTAGKHALCWAHPDRKLRDLKNSVSLSPEKRAACATTSEAFSRLYRQVRAVSADAFVKERRLATAKLLREEFKNITALNEDDPAKLRSIKQRLREQIDCYFVCLTEPSVPPDNNRAERALRHLVIKRKKSFGSKTQRGAEIMSVLYSVVMSLWRRSKKDFFKSYAEALG